MRYRAVEDRMRPGIFVILRGAGDDEPEVVGEIHLRLRFGQPEWHAAYRLMVDDAMLLWSNLPMADQLWALSDGG